MLLLLLLLMMMMKYLPVSSINQPSKAASLVAMTTAISYLWKIQYLHVKLH